MSDVLAKGAGPAGMSRPGSPSFGGRHRLHHLHLGYRWRAEGRDAQPRQYPRQLPRRLSAAQELGLDDEVFLSFLPLSHSYEHTAGLIFPISLGAAIYFAERAETLADQSGRGAADDHDRGAAALRKLASAHPTAIERESGVKRRLFLPRLGEAADEGKRFTDERLLDRVLERLVREKVRRASAGG